MDAAKLMTVCSAALLALASETPSFAQVPGPYVDMESTSLMVGVGGQAGDGLLHLPNLGTNCAYPFTVQGFGAGIQLSVSKISASGPVLNMARVSDLVGDYTATQVETTVLAGAGAASMRNRRNNVIINLKSTTAGLGLGIGAQGMTIDMPVPEGNARHAYVLEFGFNKTWVNRDGRAILDEVAADWKCRYANIWLFGHTDTVGKEDENLTLSEQRAAAARDYLIGAGIVPTRLMIRGKGESVQRVVTDDGVRLRTNRAVVVVVQE